MYREKYLSNYMSYMGGNINEASVEDDATTLKKTKEWYDNVIREFKKAESKKEIKERIDELKKVVKRMEDQRNNPDKGAGRLKYMLKTFIPFNSWARFFTKGDHRALIGNALDFVMPPLSVSYRFFVYRDMLEDMINRTNEAIEFLEMKLKKM